MLACLLCYLTVWNNLYGNFIAEYIQAYIKDIFVDSSEPPLVLLWLFVILVYLNTSILTGMIYSLIFTVCRNANVASAVYATAYLSVHLSVCPSQSGIVSQ